MTDTFHVLRGSKYHGGGWSVDTNSVRYGQEGWLPMVHESGSQWYARPVDLFATEAEARAEARSRRKPRQACQPVALYGDFAMLARMNGIRTDGTGRKSSR